MKKFFKWSLVAISLAPLAVVLIIADVQLRYISRIVSIDEISKLPHATDAIVLGASVKPDGTPSDALADRLLTAKALLDAQAVDTLFITGDDGRFHTNEMLAMRNFLDTQSSTTHEHETIDAYGGFRTYESCANAHKYGITGPAIVVTQRFHLARALYLCNQLGVDSYGVIADRQPYLDIVFFWGRDLLSSAKAWWDIHIMKPEPVKELKALDI